METFTTGMELTEHPELLFDAKVKATDLLFFGLKIGDSAALIDRSKIVTTTFEPRPPGKIKVNGRNGTWYYRMTEDGEEIEYTVGERMDGILKQGFGNLFTAEGPYVIHESKIVGFAINNNGKLANYYKTIPIDRIAERFGKPDRIIEEEEPFDGSWIDYEYIYEGRKLRIFFNDRNKHISNIILEKSMGDFMKKRG